MSNITKELTTIYKYDYADQENFNTGDDTFVFHGSYAFNGAIYILVPKNKEVDIASQPASVTLSKVTDLDEIAALACNLGFGVYPSQGSDEKIAILKTFGYDLINEYTDIDGIKEASQTWINDNLVI
jgi:hypothetical protein